MSDKIELMQISDTLLIKRAEYWRDQLHMAKMKKAGFAAEIYLREYEAVVTEQYRRRDNSLAVAL